jgi:hypothetical protein
LELNSKYSTYDESFLRQELQYIHFQLFRRRADVSFEQHYINANTSRLAIVTDTEKKRLFEIVTHNLSLEAVEIVLRNRLPILGKKINSVLYIAEATRGYEQYFLNEKSNRLASLFHLFIILIRMPIYYVLGLFLVKKYGL